MTGPCLFFLSLSQSLNFSHNMSILSISYTLPPWLCNFLLTVQELESGLYMQTWPSFIWFPHQLLIQSSWLSVVMYTYCRVFGFPLPGPLNSRICNKTNWWSMLFYSTTLLQNPNNFYTIKICIVKPAIYCTNTQKKFLTKQVFHIMTANEKVLITIQFNIYL